jgi:uncharacterized protein (DUF302 family)
MTDGPVETIVHQVHRLSIDVGAAFDDFRARYEQAVPMLDAARLAAFTNWDTVLQVAADTALHGFLIYWQADVTPLMRLAGDQSLCVEYLMGNHTIAQRMFHHDPAIMLYAPLRTAIYQDPRGRTRFSFDHPSTCFGSFGNPEITKIGIELDSKVAALLRHLKAPVPPALEAGGVPDAGIQQSTRYGVTQ